MPALAEYGSALSASLKVLSDRGYQLWFDAKTRLYCAEKDGWDFSAPSPCGLLGLITLFERRGPRRWREEWWAKSSDRKYDDLPSQPSPFLARVGR